MSELLSLLGIFFVCIGIVKLGIAAYQKSHS